MKQVVLINDIPSKQNFTTWHRVVDSSQLVMGLMKTRRNLNFEVSKQERNFIQILRYLMHLTNLS